MPAPGQAYGLNIMKKGAPGSRAPPAKRKTIFDDEENSDGADGGEEVGVEEIGEFGGFETEKTPKKTIGKKLNALGGKPPARSLGANKAPIGQYGDLSSAFTSKKHAEKAEEVDANIYDYDAIYDSMKPKKKEEEDDGEEKKPKYMGNLIAAAAVRKRDATIAEEKKLAREREAEGEEFADKEKFVTAAYKKQQEENRRLEEEEKIREAAEAKKNKGIGMTSFSRKLLDKAEQQRAEVVKAVEQRLKDGPVEEVVEKKEKTQADFAREINAKIGGAIAINDEGEVVDKRQLLSGGLNIIAKPKKPASSTRGGMAMSDRSRGGGYQGTGGSAHERRERQTKMIAEQLEQTTKRAREEEEEERLKIERAAKSTKTAGDIMGAKERYLARKREAEDAKRKAQAE